MYLVHLIIELGYAQYGFSGYYAYVLGSLTAGLTAFYSFRLISLTFLTYPNAKRVDYLNSHEASISVIIPLTILALFSIFFGYVCSDLYVGIASDFLGNSIYIKPDNITLVEAEFSLPIIFKLLPAILTLFGATLGILVYHKTALSDPEFIISLTDPAYATQLNTNRSEGLATPHPELELVIKAGYAKSNLKVFLRDFYTLLNSKFLFDILYNNYIISRGLNLGYIISKTLDKGLIELIGPYGLANTIYNTGKNLAKLDTGIVTTYSLYISLGLLTLLFLIFAPMYLFTPMMEGGVAIATLNISGDVSYGLGMERIFIIYFVTLILILTSSK